MTLFIYNINNQNSYSEGIVIAEDIDLLWQGKDWTEFEKETGLSQDELGGIIKENGNLLFSGEKKSEYDQSQKPIAYGKDIVRYVERFFIGSHWNIRKQLQAFFIQTGIKSLLESETCNPMSLDDMNELIMDINTFTQLGEVQRVLADLATEYKISRRFISEGGT